MDGYSAAWGYFLTCMFFLAGRLQYDVPGGHRQLLLHPKETKVFQLGGKPDDKPDSKGETQKGEGADICQEPEEEEVFPEN